MKKKLVALRPEPSRKKGQLLIDKNWNKSYRAGLAALTVLRAVTGDFHHYPFYGLHGAAAKDFFKYVYRVSDVNDSFHPSPHEGAGGFCAIGFAEYTGLPGIVVTSSGPGVQNLHSAVQDAFYDSVPLLVLCANVSTDELGAMTFQNSDVVRDFASKTRSVVQVEDPRCLASIVLRTYYETMQGKHGPHMIDVPADVLSSKVTFNVDTSLEDLTRENTEFDTDAFAKALIIVQGAARPVVLMGGGAKRANGLKMMESTLMHMNYPVACTLKGKGVIPDSYALNLGLAGMYGNASANFALHEADVIIAVGTRFSCRTITDNHRFAPDAKIVHLDVDPALDKYSAVLKSRIVSVKGNVRESAARLIRQMPDCTKNDRWLQHIRDLQVLYARIFPPTVQTERHGDMLNPDYVMSELNTFINTRVRPDEDPVFSTDVGNHQMLAARHLQVSNPRHYMTSGGFGTMGYGIPAAVGAMHANPNGTYVVITGDLSIQQYPGILRQLTPHSANDARHLGRRNMKIIVMDNADYEFPCGDMVHSILKGKNPCRPHHHRQMDHVKIAQGYGIPGEYVDSQSTLHDGLQRAFSNRGPYLLQIKVAPGQGVFPRMPKGTIATEMIYK